MVTEGAGTDDWSEENKDTREDMKPRQKAEPEKTSPVGGDGGER